MTPTPYTDPLFALEDAHTEADTNDEITDVRWDGKFYRIVPEKDSNNTQGKLVERILPRSKD